MSTQYDITKLDSSLLRNLLSEELPVSDEIEIPIETSEIDTKTFIDQECQTMNNEISLFNESTQTPHIHLKDRASQSPIITVENQDIQTEFYSNLYSSSLYIVPSSMDQSHCSSKIVIVPRENHSSPIVIDEGIQCDLPSLDTPIPIQVESKTNQKDRRSIIQQQMDEKEKQMNRIIGMIFRKK